MVVPACNGEGLASEVGVFFLSLFLEDRGEAQHKQEDTITLSGYISYVFGR